MGYLPPSTNETSSVSTTTTAMPTATVTATSSTLTIPENHSLTSEQQFFFGLGIFALVCFIVLLLYYVTIRFMKRNEKMKKATAGKKDDEEDRTVNEEKQTEIERKGKAVQSGSAEKAQAYGMYGGNDSVAQNQEYKEEGEVKEEEPVLGQLHWSWGHV